MGKKRKRRAKGPSGRRTGRGAASRDVPPQPRRRSIAGPVAAVVVGLTAILLILVAFDILPRRSSRRSAPSKEATSGSVSQGVSGAANRRRASGPGRASLPWATSSSGKTINRIAPTSGKPIVPGVVSTYKGYKIGHCCEPSRVEWEALSESRKDDDVRRFLQ